jgi:hypothetical protein
LVDDLLLSTEEPDHIWHLERIGWLKRFGLNPFVDEVGVGVIDSGITSEMEVDQASGLVETAADPLDGEVGEVGVGQVKVLQLLVILDDLGDGQNHLVILLQVLLQLL